MVEFEESKKLQAQVWNGHMNMLKSPRITTGKVVERRVSQRLKLSKDMKECPGI